MLKILGRHGAKENIELLFSGVFPEPVPVSLWTCTLPYLVWEERRALETIATTKFATSAGLDKEIIEAMRWRRNDITK